MMQVRSQTNRLSEGGEKGMEKKEKVGKLGELGMLNRRIGETEKRRLSSVPRVIYPVRGRSLSDGAVSPFPRFLSVVVIGVLLSALICVPVFAAGPEISISGVDWGIGGLLPDETAATSGDHWVISGSSDGTENITIKVASTGAWSADPSGGHGKNLFGLREDNASGKIIKSSDVSLIPKGLKPNETYGLDLWFQVPDETSEYGAHSLTLTLTVAEWVPGSVDMCGGYSYGGYCWYLGLDGASANATCSAHGAAVVTEGAEWARSDKNRVWALCDLWSPGAPRQGNSCCCRAPAIRSNGCCLATHDGAHMERWDPNRSDSSWRRIVPCTF